MVMPASEIAEMLEADERKKMESAGHRRRARDIWNHHRKQNPKAKIFALDWPSVLAVAKENARPQGLVSRYHLLPGSAFEVALGLRL